MNKAEEYCANNDYDTASWSGNEPEKFVDERVFRDNTSEHVLKFLLIKDKLYY